MTPNFFENPELAQQRMKAIYEKKGYPKNWIDKRLRGIAIRQNLTDEWKKRGIEKQSGTSMKLCNFNFSMEESYNFMDAPYIWTQQWWNFISSNKKSICHSWIENISINRFERRFLQ